MYAGFLRRLGAWLVDLFIFTIICALFSSGIELTLQSDSVGFRATPLPIIMLVGWFVYYVYAEASAWQATLGKRLFGIKVTDMQGYRISVLRSLGRNLSFAFSSLIFSIGYLMCLWTKQEQCLHDMVSGCLVVMEDVQPGQEFPPTKSLPFTVFFIILVILFLGLFFAFSLGIRFLTAQVPSIPASFEEAVREGNAKSVSDYLRRGEDPNQKTKWGNPVVFLYKTPQVLDLLLQAGADPNAQDEKGSTILTYAAGKADLEAVDLLLKAGADVKKGKPLFATCNQSFSPDAYQYMKPALIQSARVAQRLIQAGADVNAVMDDSWTVLWFCSYSGNDEVVKVLLQEKASSTIPNKYGTPPLIAAVEQGHPYVVAAFVQARAPLDVTDKKGDTALIKAIREGHTEKIVSMLLESGANPNIAGEYGLTALMYAAGRGHTEIVRMLLEAGADPKITDIGGQDALYHAALGRHRDTIDLLEKVRLSTRTQPQDSVDLLRQSYKGRRR